MALITLGANSGLKVLQAVNTHYTSTVQSTSATPADVSGFSAAITPSSSSNKILVMVTAAIGVEVNGYPYILLNRSISGGSTTAIGKPSLASGNQIDVFLTSGYQPNGLVVQTVSKNIFDTPNTTSEVTYQIQFASAHNSVSARLNAPDGTSNNAAYVQFPSSSITLLEVKQ